MAGNTIGGKKAAQLLLQATEVVKDLLKILNAIAV